PDIDIDDVGGGIEMQVPHVLQQHGPGYDLAFVANQIFEQLELARQEIDVAPATAHSAGHEIKLEITNAQDCFLHHRGAATRERLHARQQFGNGGRLDQIIVPPGAQSAHFVVNLTQRADDQSRRDNAFFAQPADYGQSINSGKHAIDGHHGIGRGAAAAQAVIAVARKINLIATGAERIDQLAGRFLVVLDDENAAPRTAHVELLQPLYFSIILSENRKFQTDIYVRNCRISHLSEVHLFFMAKGSVLNP